MVWSVSPPDGGGAGSARENIWRLKKALAAPRNPLKSLKTAKGIFGKACRFQAENLEMFGVDLEKFGARKRYATRRRRHIAEMPPSSFTSAPVMKELSSEAR